jgi:ADP-ribose pyrophosphatase YjhB (NUDIX family)
MSIQNTLPPRMVVCIGAVVLNNNRALFIRQTYGVYKGRWSIPWGFSDNDAGFPEAPDKAAVREVQEEAGITAVVTGFLGIQNDTNPINGQKEPWLYLLFQCQHQSGSPTADGKETDSATYLSLSEIASFTEEIEPFSLWLTKRVLSHKTIMIPELIETPFPPNNAFL